MKKFQKEGINKPLDESVLQENKKDLQEFSWNQSSLNSSSLSSSTSETSENLVKKTGIKYLREQREERLQKERLDEIGDQISDLYTKDIDLSEEQLKNLIELAKIENEIYERERQLLEAERKLYLEANNSFDQENPNPENE